MLPYLVCEFSKPTVSNLVKECFGSDFPDIFRKPQLAYLYQYLKDLGAQSVLLEREYLDKDYLEDYLRYYAKCFQNDGHKCARLHFFSQTVDHRSFDSILAAGPCSEAYESLSASYLGFIVVKPLPMTFIGKTCLKHYKRINAPDSNRVCLSRPYEVDLFGLKLTIQSVAFQEQDKVVSACATTAIWAALHGTQWNHEKQIPACSEITSNAINHITGSNNSFPNGGLTNKQILRALDVAGLRYYNDPLTGKIAPEELIDTVRYHIDSSTPLILGASIFTSEGEDLGGHAVTILGYSLDKDQPALYLHDDRLGPFASATFLTPTEMAELNRKIGSARENKCWKTDLNGQIGLALRRKDDLGDWMSPHEVLVPSSLIIPTNKKARIPYTLPRNTCRLIRNEYEEWLAKRGEAFAEFGEGIRYTLQLTEISKLRQRLIQRQPAAGDPGAVLRKIEFLTGSYARFQWVASFYSREKLLFKILFDATDIPQGNAISGLYVEDEKEAQPILDLFKKVANSRRRVVTRDNKSFFGAWLRFLRRKPPSWTEYLERTFGELRAPRYLKASEVADDNIKSNDSVQRYYESVNGTLEIAFGAANRLIWAIADDGALLVGSEQNGQGHPTLTGFKAARIAGELNKGKDGRWLANSKSGRYSADYPNPRPFLENAVRRIAAIFPDSTVDIDSAVSG